MSSDAGAPYRLLIKASIRAGVRPTTMILGEDNRKAWSDMDVLIMQAYETLEAERCQDCGYPIWICRNTDQRIDWKVKPYRKCDAMLAVEDYDENNKSKDKDGAERGRPTPSIRNDEFPLDRLRESYYRQQAEDLAQD